MLKKNGLPVDTQNKNPSRLSRMPGVMRKGRKQFLMDTNIGKASFKEWQEWIEAVTDDLPNPEGLEDVWGDLPELAPPLIDGVLRQGHKMLIAGPSKAGKSYGLIELACAIAEGRDWFGWKCSQGRVMYVNLELDRASCLHRFKDIYTATGWQPRNIRNIDIWNLRGKSVPMDKLAPKLIRRAANKGKLQTSDAQRTGCSMCGFGIHMEERPNRFDLLWERNAKEWDFWMHHVVQDENGKWYGWDRVLDYIGVKWDKPWLYIEEKRNSEAVEQLTLFGGTDEPN